MRAIAARPEMPASFNLMGEFKDHALGHITGLRQHLGNEGKSAFADKGCRSHGNEHPHGGMLGAQAPQQGDGLIDHMTVERGAKAAAIGIQGQFCIINFDAIGGGYAEANTVVGRCIG